jgi:hypothetical protein
VHREVKENPEINMSSPELNALQWQRWLMFRESAIRFGKPGLGEADLCRRPTLTKAR